MKADTVAETCLLSLLMFTDVKEGRYPIFLFGKNCVCFRCLLARWNRKAEERPGDDLTVADVNLIDWNDAQGHYTT